MRVVPYLLAAGSSMVVTAVLSVVMWKLAERYRIAPEIRERDVHTRPTPRLGGVAMFFGTVSGFFVASFFSQTSLIFAQPLRLWGLLGAAVMIVVLGVVDDMWDLDWLTKLSGQLLAATLLAWSGVQFLSFPIPGYIVSLAPWQSLVITIILIALVMNAINFIDGLDGLVAGVAVIASGVFLVYLVMISAGSAGQSDYLNLAQLISAVLIGSCVGFLPLNWHPAKLFMGDAGALLVGLMMAASTIAVTGQIDPVSLDTGVRSARQFFPALIPLLLPFAILVVPLLDFGLAVIRRLHAGKSPFSADKGHLHHRLLDMGHSHLHAVFILYGWTLVVSMGMLLFLFLDTWWAASATVVALLVCTAFTFAPLSRKSKEQNIE